MALLGYVGECFHTLRSLNPEEWARLKPIRSSLSVSDRASLDEEVNFAVRLSEAGYRILRVHYAFEHPETGARLGEVDVLATAPDGALVWFELKRTLRLAARKSPGKFEASLRQYYFLEALARGDSRLKLSVDRVYVASLNPIPKETLQAFRKRFPLLIPIHAGEVGPLGLEPRTKRL